MSGKPVVLLGAMEEAEEEDKPPEQPIVERDPTGRWSRVDQILGRGAFKTVYKGFDEDEGIEVAWNQVRVSELVSTKEERDRLFAEIRVLKQLKHKNIMTFYDSWLDSKTMTVNFITELFTSGTLRQYRKKHKHIDPEVLKRWAWQILCGLVYLHGHTPSIIHRDLKSDNIFINGCEGVVKIGDLGLATMLRARTAPQSVLGTPEFMAPELYEEEYDDRVDVYSFGMCLLELATLEYPYAECRNAAQIYRKVSQGILPAGLAKVPTGELAEFISVCIAPRQHRPRARHLLKHPYFHTIRAEKAAVKLGAEALAHSVSCAADLHQMVADCAASVAGSVSRTSSELAEVQHVLTSTPLDSSRHGPFAESRAAQPLRDELPEGQQLTEQSHSMPLVDHPAVWRPDPLLEKPEGVSPPHSEPGRNEFGDRDGAESWATVRTARDSFETASTSHAHMQERCMSECSERDDQQPVLTGHRSFCVKGKVQEEEDKLSLRLRIGHTEGGGAPKTVEFDFDLAADTAYSVANEMVSDLSLSHEDAKMIAKAIKEEVVALTEASTPHRRYVSIFSDDDDEEQQKGPAPMAIDVSGLDEGHLVAAAAAVLSEQPIQGPAKSSLTRQDASAFQNGREYENSAQHPGQLSGEDMLSEDGTHPQHDGVQQDGVPARPGSDVSMLSRSNSQGALEPDDADASSLIGRKRSSSKLNPPKEEDRTLPLKKLFENLTGVTEANQENGGPPSNGSASSAFVTSPVPKAASIAGELPHLDLHINTCSVSEGASTQRLGPLERKSLSRVLSVSQDIDGMAVQKLSNGTPSQRVSPTRVPPLAASAVTPNGVSSPGLSPAAAFARNPWSSSSCLHTSACSTNGGLMSSYHSQPCLVKPRSSRDDTELKELRRREAAAAASEMESRSLLGLDRFGVAHGCAQNKKGGLLGNGVGNHVRK